MGEHLLMDAIERVRLAAATIAIHAIVVDAKNETARSFYLKYGFLSLESCELSLFLPLETMNEI